MFEEQWTRTGQALVKFKEALLRLTVHVNKPSQPEGPQGFRTASWLTEAALSHVDAVQSELERFQKVCIEIARAIEERDAKKSQNTEQK